MYMLHNRKKNLYYGKYSNFKKEEKAMTAVSAFISGNYQRKPLMTDDVIVVHKNKVEEMALQPRSGTHQVYA